MTDEGARIDNDFDPSGRDAVGCMCMWRSNHAFCRSSRSEYRDHHLLESEDHSRSTRSTKNLAAVDIEWSAFPAQKVEVKRRELASPDS